MIGCRDLPDTGTARRAAAALLASAFWDDPLARYVEPDAALRPAVVAAFFDALIAAAVGPAAIHVTTGRIKGVAVWLPPSAAAASETELFVSLAAMDPYHAQRFEYAIGALDGIHESVIDVPHWYLIFLGVAPAAQGKGIGGRLLEATHAIADVGQTACFLETFDGPNVPFYRRRGYEIVSVRSVPFAVEPVVAMRRRPHPRPQDHPST